MEKKSYPYLLYLLLCIPLGIFFYCFIPQYLIPTEDAAILFAYAENWAQTGVISYYPGGAPTEGATDFLFLVLVTLGIKAGLKTYTSALLINGIATLLSVYFLSRIVRRSSTAALLLSVAFIFSASQLGAGLYGYGTMAYGAAILFTIWQFYRNNFALTVTGALITMLFRPDGFVIMAPLILLYCLKDLSELRYKLRTLLLYGIIPGMLYFAGRYLYFGELFPLPFYVKTSGQGKIWGLFLESSFHVNKHYLRYTLLPLLTGLSAAFLLRRKDINGKEITIAGTLICVPLLFYSMTQQDMNLGYRYQYPVYLGTAILTLRFICQYRTWWLIPFSLLTFYLLNKDRRLIPDTRYSNLYLVPEALNAFRGKMAVTDAGYMAWKSKWEVADMWGLNTLEYARRLILPEDLEQFRPDLVEITGFTDLYHFPELRTQKTFNNMGSNAYLFALRHDYEIWDMPRGIIEEKGKTVFNSFIDRWLCFSPYVPNRITFCVRKDFEYYDEVVTVMKKHQAIRVNKENISHRNSLSH